jgi:hypothetical protein
LNTGVTFVNFHSVGKILVDNERLKSLHRGYFNIDEASLRSLGLSMSGPVAFEVSKVFNTLLSWIKNYLSNRKQRIVINNSNSQ